MRAGSNIGLTSAPLKAHHDFWEVALNVVPDEKRLSARASKTN
jgi:hypothetical protein